MANVAEQIAREPTHLTHRCFVAILLTDLHITLGCSREGHSVSTTRKSSSIWHANLEDSEPFDNQASI